MTRSDHDNAEARSLELHRLVADRLRAEPTLLVRAQARVRGWLRDGTVSRVWAEAWAEALSRPLPELIALLGDPGQRARDLRQSSPFAGVLPPQERWAALRRLKGRTVRP